VHLVRSHYKNLLGGFILDWGIFYFAAYLFELCSAEQF
jgi:hypothetical protein